MVDIVTRSRNTAVNKLHFLVSWILYRVMGARGWETNTNID